MAGKEQDYRVFVGGLSWDITERQLQDTFRRYGKIIDCQIMLERDTGRPRGFGFLTFADRRAMEDAIREMNGRELGDRAISVNKAQPKMDGDDPPPRYGYSSGGRGSYGGDRSAGQDDCFKCGRPGHWARDCPSAGGARGARPLTPPRFGGVGGRVDRYSGDRDRYIEDRGRYGDRATDRYPPPMAARVSGDRYDRFAGSDHYPPTGYGKDRYGSGYERDVGPRGGGDRYGGRGLGRFEGRSYRERPGPYDRPRRAGHASSYDRY